MLRGALLCLSGETQAGLAVIDSARTKPGNIPAAYFDPSKVNWEAELAYEYASELSRYRKDPVLINEVLERHPREVPFGARADRVVRQDRGIRLSWNAWACLRYLCAGCFAILRRFPYSKGGKCPHCRKSNFSKIPILATLMSSKIAKRVLIPKFGHIDNACAMRCEPIPIPRKSL